MFVSLEQYPQYSVEAAAELNPTDVYESSVNGGVSWIPYSPGATISSAVIGANRLQIRTQRTSTGPGLYFKYI